MAKLPSLDFTGQTTSELLAAKDSHSPHSVLFAFESGIQSKVRQIGEAALTDEERLVLTVQAVDREVNNGGYYQFFWNSSRRFAPIAVESLRRLGRTEAASLTERAIAALKLKSLTIEAVEQAILKKNAKRDAILDACDQEFYKIVPAYATFLQFIEDHQAQIQLAKTDDYPRRERAKGLSTSASLGVHLFVHSLRNKGWAPNLEEASDIAIKLAKEQHILYRHRYQRGGDPVRLRKIDLCWRRYIGQIARSTCLRVET